MTERIQASRRRTAVAITVALFGALSFAACSDPAPTKTADPTEASETREETPQPTPTEAPPTTAEAGGLTWELVIDETLVPREIIPAGDGHFLSDQTGIVSFLNDGELSVALDLTDRILPPTSSNLELGLAGFALAPDFDETGSVYTTTTEQTTATDTFPGAVNALVLTRWTADAEAGTIDEASAVEIMRIPMSTRDHVGGEIAFDEAGSLYTGVGTKDGNANAQDPSSWFGKIFRITPTDNGYTVPADNPYATGGGIAKIYSLGYRNPWRLATVDGAPVLAEALSTHKDQQVSALTPGANSGYPDVRGSCWLNGAIAPTCALTKAGATVTPPLFEYGSSIGQVASGVAQVPVAVSAAPLAGKVVVSDWAGKLVAATPGSAPWPSEEVVLPESITKNRLLWDIAADDATVYLMTTSNQMKDGQVWRLVL